MVNKVILIGHVGQNPELRHTQSGTAILKFSLATTERWIDSNSHERKEETQWHRITAWGKLAELNADVLRSGSKIYIEGKLKYSSYEKEGNKVYVTDIMAKTINWLDKKDSSGKPAVTQKSQKSTNSSQPPEPEEIYSEEPDDDIPF